jgi:hypothetical protein
LHLIKRRLLSRRHICLTYMTFNFRETYITGEIYNSTSLFLLRFEINIVANHCSSWQTLRSSPISTTTLCGFWLPQTSYSKLSYPLLIPSSFSLSAPSGHHTQHPTISVLVFPVGGSPLVDT